MVSFPPVDTRSSPSSSPSPSLPTTPLVSPRHPMDLSDLTIIRDVPYIPESKLKSHQFDIYYGKYIKPQDKLPVVIHVHGGGWQRGSSRNEWRGAPHVGRSCGRHDAIGVCINYRMATPASMALVLRAFITTLILALITLPIRVSMIPWWGYLVMTIGFTVMLHIYYRGASSHPSTVQDVAIAITYIHQHITKHVPQADATQIFLSGHSAGAHLVSLVALDQSWLQAAGCQDTSFIKGVISMSGIYTIDRPCHPSYGHWRNIIFRALYAQSAFGSDAAVWSAVSPINHVHQAKMPFLVMSAESDMGLETDAERFVSALRSVGATVECEVISATSHASIASQFIRHHAKHHFFHFITKYYQKQQIE